MIFTEGQGLVTVNKEKINIAKNILRERKVKNFYKNKHEINNINTLDSDDEK